MGIKFWPQGSIQHIGGGGRGGISVSAASFASSITPSVGAEIMADPGLEGNYTAGQNDGLTKSGSPTLAQSADVHGGLKAQQLTATASGDALRYVFTPLANTFYRFSTWGKRTAGTTGGVTMFTFQTAGPLNHTSTAWTGATYTQKVITPLSGNTNSLSLFAARDGQAVAFDTIIFDDMSVKAISLPSCLASFRSADALTTIVKANVSAVAGCPIGVAANIDSATNPQNFLAATVVIENTAMRIILYQVLGGAITIVQNTVKTYVANALIEIRHTATTTYQVWYNGLQVGTDVTVNQAAINSNTLYAQFSTYEGNTFTSYGVVPNP